MPEEPTHGPWGLHWEEGIRDNELVVRITGPSGVCLAYVAMLNSDNTRYLPFQKGTHREKFEIACSKARANANLMSKAPELLDLLEEAKGMLEVTPMLHEEQEGLRDELVKRMGRATRKSRDRHARN